MDYKYAKRMHTIKKYIFEIGMSMIGCATMAFATSFFLLPNQLSSGGFTGLATILYYIFKFPVGIVLMVLNTPLYIWSYFRLGKEFVFKGIVGTAFLSIFIDLFDKFPALTADRTLACVYGGIIIGIGSALILKASASTGGSDLLAYLIKSYFPNFRTSNIIMGIDIVIISLNMIVFKDIEIGLYSAIAIYIMGKMIDIVFEGVYFTKMIFIISDKYMEISKEIEGNVKRGITGLQAKGMYTNDDKMMLWCIASRNEAIKIKELCKKLDKNSFVVIASAREAYGIGFKT